MARFFDKKELVLIALLILLFDFNGFCDVVIPHIMFKDKQVWGTFLMVFAFLIIDAYIYSAEADSLPLETITFSNNQNHEEHSCDNIIKEQKEKFENKMEELHNICNVPEPKGYSLMKKISLTTITFILVAIYFIAVTSKGDYGENILDSVKSRALRGSPLLLIGLIIMYLAYK